jgi:hypothetical protein
MDGEYPAGTRPAGDKPAAGDKQATGDKLATGDERVDEAVAGLAGLADKPVEEHPAVLSEVHARLGEILGEAGQGDDPGPA